MSRNDLAELDHSRVANSTTEPAPRDLPATPPPIVSSSSSKLFFCPGETHPISHSVHLARLSSFYEKCRECSHRHDVVQLSPLVADQFRNAIRTVKRPSYLTGEGVRGIYLNEIDRTVASAWSAALASILWDAEPRRGRTPSDSLSSESKADVELDDGADAFSMRRVTTSRRGPLVVIGFDERPSSPDIVTGVALGLRRMGCQVIDLGQTTIPCLHFAVQHLEAAAGMFVTGAGCDPAWTGFEFISGSVQPLSASSRLYELESRSRQGVMRPTRTAGSQRTFHAQVPYESGMWKHFHALRPLHIVCGSATRQLPRTLDRLFAKLPCRLTHISLPIRHRNLAEARDADVQRIASAVVGNQQHLGLIVDDDGQHCAFISERGRLISVPELARLLINFERREHRDIKVSLTEPLSDELAQWLTRRGIEAFTAGNCASDLTTALTTYEARMGFSGDGRVWFADGHPVCDAIITLARVLQALSLSDASFDEAIAHVSRI